VALTGLVFTLLSGSAARTGHLVQNASLSRSFVGAMVFLAATALAAALLAALHDPSERATALNRVMDSRTTALHRN